jgi:ribosomal protein S18 acetylase RimI-like enzyme
MSTPPISPDISWTDDLARIDWDEACALYRAAPLGDKSPRDLNWYSETACFAPLLSIPGIWRAPAGPLADGRDCSYICDIAVHPDQQGRGLGKEIIARLVRLSASHRKIILCAVPGKETFYERFGFRRMTTAMAIFEDQAGAYARGYLRDI